jgi:hypothetical protein
MRRGPVARAVCCCGSFDMPCSGDAARKHGEGRHEEQDDSRERRQLDGEGGIGDESGHWGGFLFLSWSSFCGRHWPGVFCAGADEIDAARATQQKARGAVAARLFNATIPGIYAHVHESAAVQPAFRPLQLYRRYSENSRAKANGRALTRPLPCLSESVSSAAAQRHAEEERAPCPLDLQQHGLTLGFLCGVDFLADCLG